MVYFLPTFLVLGSNVKKNEYLTFIHENNNFDGYLEFSKIQAVSPYAKFQVERAKGQAGENGLVHIRSCMNNKYLKRTKNISITKNPAEQHWITATANKPEEDQSKDSCTLFKPISVDSREKTVRIMHVQSGCYLCLWGLRWKDVVLANYKVFDHQSCDIFKVIDWESFVILPKYVAFKGDNGRYLCLRWIEGHPYLQFDSDDIGDPTVACEIVVNHDGNIRIKSNCSKKFWRRSPNWIWVDSDQGASTVNIPLDTLFCPKKYDNHTIALKNLGNNYFCKRLTTEGKTSCLNAAVLNVTREAYLTVEEPVMTREIHDIRYKLDYSRIYDENVLVVAKNSAHNYNREPSSLDVKLSYTDTQTTAWKVNGSLKIGAKVSSDFNIPLIIKGKIEVSAEIQVGVEWSTTTTSTRVLELVHKVTVPAMTKVTVDLVATKGKCDVPFSFVQRDTHYDGSIVTTEEQGGSYTGSNFYNIDFQSREEPIN